MTIDEAPSADGIADQLMRDALILELHREGDGADAQWTKLRLVARKLVDKAIAGDVQAIKEIYDRIDGKSVAGATAADEGPRKVILEWNDDFPSDTDLEASSSPSTAAGSASPAS